MESGTGQDLKGIWGSSATDVFAVGSGGTVIHYDGTGWSSMQSWTDKQLNAIWGSSPGNVFAVGVSGTILTFDGSTWSQMSSGITDELAQLKGVWGSSDSNVFAVGTSGTILQFNGTIWTAMASGTSNFLNSVWGNSTDNVFTVGDMGTILFYDGTPAVTTTTTSISPPDGCPVEEIYGRDSKQAELLRIFRDSVMSKTAEGRTLIALYYGWGPFIVKTLHEDAEFKQCLREMIDGLLPMAVR
jgi:hypothetical protein